MTRRIGSAVFFVLFVSFTLLMAACADSSNSNTHSNTNSTMANSNANSNGVSSGDRDFMTKAAIGGMEEVQLGRLAAQKGASNDVKQAEQINYIRLPNKALTKLSCGSLKTNACCDDGEGKNEWNE